MSNIYEQLANLSSEQRALFEQRLREQGVELPTANRILPRTTDEDLPLSYAQQRLWFVQEFDPDNIAYNVSSALRLQGPLDRQKLDGAIHQIIARHEALRTSFHKNGEGKPVQQIHEPTQQPIPFEDLIASGEEEARQCIAKLSSDPFDLSTPPLRFLLLKLGSDDHVLALATHHLVCDRWSVMIFMRELAHFYGGGDSALGELAIQCADWALWQQEQLQGDALQTQLTYWKDRLDGTLPQLELPLKADAARASHQGQHFPLEFDSQLTDQIRQLANQSQASLFVILLAAFKVLLHRYDGGTDIVVGSEVANRDRPETAGLIGLLVNTLVLRTDLSGNPTFNDLIERVRETVQGGLNHQDLPFEKLVETLNPDRDLDQLTPLFQVKFDLQQVSIPQKQLGDIAFAPFPSEETQTKYALRLNLQEDEKGIRGQIEFSTDLFDTPAIERLARHYTTLLVDIVANSDQAIDSFALILPEERDQLLTLGEGRQRSPVNTTLHKLFETQVGSTPDGLAVIDGDSEFSYAQLNELADRYAGRLRGIARGSRVGVCLRKSADMVAAMLGILKVGAAYVPLDPDYPDERLEFIIADARCAAVFTEGPAGAELEIKETSHDGSMPNLAYLIYTSGSTGQPKGVAISHNAASEMVHWAGDVFSPKELAGTLVSTSICFDLSVFEIFVPLSHGGALILADNLLSLPKLPGRDRVTLLNTVPSLLRQLFKLSSLPDSVRTINLAGEALPADLVGEIHERGVSKVYNLYGPSEDTTYSTFTSLHAGEFDPATETVTIGRPIDNTHAYVLDPAQRPVPVGITGELYLGGAGLASGYWDRDELTANSFVINPLGESPPSLYRTGDKVRWREDGQLEFLGRLDHQFKIRGFRIEAGEIEAILRAHSDVEESLVLANHDRGDAELLAYVVPKHESADLTQRLRTHLSERLPSAMVPSLWHRLEKMPRLPNGKVNRAKLPRPSSPSTSTPYLAPETDTEKQLAETWARLLGQARVGTHDNFFDLGGHSLLAIQLVTQLESQFSVKIPLRTLFERATVSGLANWLDEQDGSGVSDEAFAVQSDPNSRYEPFPLTDIQQAYWLGRNGAFELGNIATHGYREIDTKGIPHEAIQRAYNELIRRHDMLRAIVQPEGQQRVLEEVPEYKIEVREDEKCEEIRERLSHQVFDTATWPLFHIEAIAKPDGGTRYFVSFDVILGDAWSLQILGREMKQLLLGMPLPPLALTFRDYVLAERAHNERPEAEASWWHWQEKVPHLPAAPELPLIKSPAELEKPEVNRRSARLTAAQWTALKEKARQHRLTDSGFVLAVFAEVLGTWSRKRSFTINLTLFNRQPVHPDIDSVIGDFTSSTLIACDQRNSESFAGRAADVQSTLWESLEHRSVSGVRIIRELARQQRSGVGAVMPVVFTSTLGKMTGSTRHEDWEADVVFGLSQTSQVYLDHQVSEIDGELVLNWDCIESLWPTGVVDEMFASYQAFLISLTEDNATWERLPRLIPTDPCEEMNREAKSSAEPSGELLHGLFLKQVKATPDAVAIITDDREISYGELASSAISVAAQLQTHDVKPNELVAIGIPKGWEQIAACLAIQIAGAAYIPIDVTLPAGRRQQILADTEARVILTSDHGPKDWPDSVSQIEVTDAGSAEEFPAAKQSATDLAYVIYTSGSTGKPKGVMIDHRGAVNTVLDINERIGLQPSDRVFALSSLSFDLSVYDIFGPLAAGAAIVIGSDASRSEDPEYWLEQLRQGRVTVWNSVPALAQLLVDALQDRKGKADDLPLRNFLLSGDWIPLPLPDALKKQFPNATVTSLGGATEASIWSIIHPIEKLSPDWPSVPYGVPMKNQEWFVLDENGNPCPPWVPGELHIGGIGVAKGYWRRPELTAERFVASDHSSGPLYRTGDWGRLRPANGDCDAPLILEFLGREDFQVKINGYRIELGEIEAALQRHGTIEQAVVTTHGSELLAYLVPRADPATKLQQKTATKSEDKSGIVLPDSANPRPPFRRQSHRRFLEQNISLQTLADFLTVLRPQNVENSPLPKFQYPSAGGLYPVDTFVSVKPDRVSNLPGGWYRYDATGNQLIPIDADIPTDKPDLYPVNESVFDQSAFTCFFIGNLRKIESTYGDRARDFCLLEAGYLGQLLMETAPNHNLGLCPANEREFASLPANLNLDESHICLHALIAGPIDLAWSDKWMAIEQPDAESFQDQLEAYLQTQLPAYMIPRRFQILTSLPLSANGKIDRAALPVPNQQSDSDYVAPRDDLEHTITELWQQLLNIDRVGIHDDFFQLGGNSLLAIQLLGQLRNHCAPNLSMAQLFGALNPAAQADLIRSMPDGSSEEVSIPRVARDTESVNALSDEEVAAQLEQLLGEEKAKE